MQSFRESALESFLNVATSIIVAWLLWIFIVPIFIHVTVTHTQSFTVILIFQMASFLRMLLWRRVFNWYDEWRKGNKTQ